MKVSVSAILFRSLLILVYAGFILVQISCVTGPDNITVPTAAHFSLTQPSKEKIVTAKHNRKTNVRLNKRFQPVITAEIPNPLPEAPIKYLNKSNSAKPEDYLLISIILATSLRGPPGLI